MSKFREICRILLKANEKKEKCGSSSRFNNSHRRVSWRCGRVLLTICPYFVNILFIIHKKFTLFNKKFTNSSRFIHNFLSPQQNYEQIYQNLWINCNNSKNKKKNRSLLWTVFEFLFHVCNIVQGFFKIACTTCTWTKYVKWAFTARHFIT